MNHALGYAKTDIIVHLEVVLQGNKLVQIVTRDTIAWMAKNSSVAIIATRYQKLPINPREQAVKNAPRNLYAMVVYDKRRQSGLENSAHPGVLGTLCSFEK